MASLRSLTARGLSGDVTGVISDVRPSDSGTPSPPCLNGAAWQRRIDTLHDQPAYTGAQEGTTWMSHPAYPPPPNPPSPISRRSTDGRRTRATR